MPRTQGTIFEKLTDTAKYTGTHRHRFDDEGNGMGLEGTLRAADMLSRLQADLGC